MSPPRLARLYDVHAPGLHRFLLSLTGCAFHYTTDPTGLNFEIWTPRRINSDDVRRDTPDWAVDDRLSIGPFAPG